MDCESDVLLLAVASVGPVICAESLVVSSFVAVLEFVWSLKSGIVEDESVVAVVFCAELFTAPEPVWLLESGAVVAESVAVVVFWAEPFAAPEPVWLLESGMVEDESVADSVFWFDVSVELEIV